MSITCFPVGSTAGDSNYMNHSNGQEQANPNANLINSLNSSAAQYRKLAGHPAAENGPLNSNVIQNSKSDLLISGFDSLSRTATPISYLANSSLDGYFNNTSTLGTPNPPLNLLSSQLNSRCHSSNSNCSTNSKLAAGNLAIGSRPVSSLDQFLNNHNTDSNDSTGGAPTGAPNASHPNPMVFYYPHIVMNENNSSYSNNLSSLSNLSASDLQTDGTPALHHSPSFGQAQQAKDDLAPENAGYPINFNHSDLANSSASLSNSLNRSNQANSDGEASNNPADFSGKKRRRQKGHPGPPARPTCPECGKDFSNQSALSKHKLTHSDERKFVCPLCGKSFKRMDHLNGHLFTHREKKPYQCDFKNCEKTYCDARSLKRHKENHHPPLLCLDFLNVVKTADGSRIQYVPSSSGEPGELELAKAMEKILEPNQFNEKSQEEILEKLISKVKGNSAALTLLQQHMAEQQYDYVECPVCQKKFKNLPALNGHMRLHGGYIKGHQPPTQSSNGVPTNQTSNQVNNQNSNQPPRTDGQPTGSNGVHKQNEQPIDLIKKEGLFADLINKTNSQQSVRQVTERMNEPVKDKLRKYISNTPVIMENPEANRYQMMNNRVSYYGADQTTNGNLLSVPTINQQQGSPLVDQLQQLESQPSPITSEALIQEQDLLNNNSQLAPDKQLENGWFENSNALKEQPFRAPNKGPVTHQPTAGLNGNNLTGGRCPTSIPAHVFSGEKFRRHSDSTAEILNQTGMNHHPNYGHHLNAPMNHGSPLSVQQPPQRSQIQHQMPQAMGGLHQPHLQTNLEYDPTGQIENNNNLVDFDYLKRKQIARTESETSANETMESLPESQLMNSSTNANYLSASTNLTSTNHVPNNHPGFYNNACNNLTSNSLAGNTLTYQSHSVPTTPTVNNPPGSQNFFSHRLDLNHVTQQLNQQQNQHQNQHQHDYSDQQLSNQSTISHHQLSPLPAHQSQHSLPCTPKQSTGSFTFSQQQVQLYQQQNQQQNQQPQYHNSHYNSSPNTPHTPHTPHTPLTPTSANQYQDSLIMQQPRPNLHQQAVQSHNLNTINSAPLHKNSLYPSVEFNNNTICSRGKFGQQQNYGMIGNHQFIDSNDNLTSDHLNNAPYSTMLNDDFMVNDTANYGEQQFSSACQLSGGLDNQRLDNQRLNNQRSDGQRIDNQRLDGQSLDNQRNTAYQINGSNVLCGVNGYQQPAQHQVSNVIMSNYATAEPFCETAGRGQHLIKSNHCNHLNNGPMADLTKGDRSGSASDSPLNCTTNATSEKPYTRVTLRSVSPNLVIETDSYKNSTADDSTNYANLAEDAEEEDDDVFLKPTEINQPISSPKTNCLTVGAGKKPQVNSASGTYLASTNHGQSSANLPQVDFTHPSQQPKLAAATGPTRAGEAISRGKTIEEHHINDLNFNQIKISSLDKGKQTVELNSENSADSEQGDKQGGSRTGSPSRRWKHRPEPLYIPPHVNARIHQKPPRPWPAINDGSNLPPPYTPPPMLSPVRTNSSYYYYILSGNLTPKSVTNFFTNRKSLAEQPAVAKRPSFDFFNEPGPVATPSTAYEPPDSSLPNVETTFDFSNYSNTNAHVNIGVQYQARIPAFNPNKEDAKLHYRSEHADRVWCPSILERLTYSNLEDSRKCKVIMNSKRKTNLMKEFDLYIQLSSSSCISGNGSNREYAYHVLYLNNGDLSRSIMQLLTAQPVIKPDHPLYGYKYPETSTWTSDEIRLYYEALLKYDKDFLTISKQLENKSVKQCIEFYYLWKKVCHEEYRKHRLLRRKKEQEGIFDISNGKV